MKTPLLIILSSVLIWGCQKPITALPEALNLQPADPTDTTSVNSNVLVDASKDGGGWWFPQGPGIGFSETADHQGKALAEYLRAFGFHVDELPRGAVITNELLQKYSKIIRAPAFFNYTDDEIAAYKNFLNKPGSAILLFQDHLSYTINDKLSELLGLQFAGAIDGIITNFTPNEVTNGVTELPYIAGAVVINSMDNPAITVWGSIDKNTYTVLNNSDPFAGGTQIDPPVMGTVNNYPNTKIFFMGDVNEMEYLPQPFTQNLVSWLFK